MIGIRIERARSDEVDVLVEIDDEASALYATRGLALDFGRDHPLVEAERARWARACADGRAFVVAFEQGLRAGFAVLDLVDARPYLDQVSVRPSFARRGLGRALVQFAKDWSLTQTAAELWLTTYAHVPWNRPFYAREGFETVSESVCGPALRALLAEQRRWLPDPEQRVAMCWRERSE